MLAYLSDILSKQQRIFAYSIGYAFASIGLIIGVGLSVLIGIYYDDKVQFITISIINIISLIYVIFFIPESLSKNKRKKFKFNDSNPFKPFYRCCNHPIIIWCAIIQFLISLPEVGIFDIALIYALDILHIENESKVDEIRY